MDFGSEIYAEMLRREREMVFASHEYAHRAAYLAQERATPRPVKQAQRRTSGFGRAETASPLF